MRLGGLAAALVLVSLPGAAETCPAGTVTGEVTYIRGGDTIELGAMAIRLQGLAAPEGAEPGALACVMPALWTAASS